MIKGFMLFAIIVNYIACFTGGITFLAKLSAGDFDLFRALMFPVNLFFIILLTRKRRRL